jgi:hypothetical protein
MDDTKKKKAVAKATEVLEAIGQESEKEGVKWTKYFMDLWDKEQWNKEQIIETSLGRKKHKLDYIELLRRFLEEQLFSLERPNFGYWVEVGKSKIGVYAKLHDRWGKVWSRGIKACGVPKMDYNAVWILVETVDDKMWELEEGLKTEGIHLV